MFRKNSNNVYMKYQQSLLVTNNKLWNNLCFNSKVEKNIIVNESNKICTNNISNIVSAIKLTTLSPAFELCMHNS